MTRFLRLLSMAAVSLAAFGFTPAHAQVFKPTSFHLSNGLQVVVVENHRAPIVSHMVWYKVGAADEPAGKTGIAHLLEHMMFKGTATLAPGEFSKIVAINGGRDNAFTSSDFTAYYQNIAVDRLDMMMRMEADRMRNLTFDEQNFLTERDVVLEERRSRTDNSPDALLMERLDAALYINHPYRHPIIGWPSEVAALSREDALAFYRRWYAPNNAILVVAGDVQPAAVLALAERYYGSIPAVADTPQRQRLQEPPAIGERRVVLDDPRAQSPSWVRLYQAPSYRQTSHPLHPYALQVLEEILGGGTTSRFYAALVVQQGLAASLSVDYNPVALDYAPFSISATPRPNTDPETIERALEQQIQALLTTHPVTEDDVRQAKARMVARIVYARDSLHSGAYVLGQALTTGQTVDDVEDWPNRIAQVSAEQVNAVARAIMQKNNSVTGILRRSQKTEAGLGKESP